jgi:hypothetical protein
MTPDPNSLDMRLGACCCTMGFRFRQTTTKNPQENSVCERSIMHQAIGNSLRVLRTLNHPPAGVEDALLQQLDTVITNAVYATRCTYHGSLRTTPGCLAFRCGSFPSCRLTMLPAAHIFEPLTRITPSHHMLAHFLQLWVETMHPGEGVSASRDIPKCPRAM